MSRTVIAVAFHFIVIGSALAQNVQVNSRSTEPQEETVIQVDPSDRLHLIGGAIDERSGQRDCVFYSSFDGGLTWHELFFPNPRSGIASEDPCAAIGKSGETYFAALSKTGEIYVGRSFDGGLTVPNWVLVEVPGGAFDDRPNLAIDAGDDALSGALYCTWTRVQASGAIQIYMSASFDGGQTWTPRARVGDSSFCTAGFPAVGPNGELYITFDDLVSNSIRMDRSLDGGVTWHHDQIVASFNLIWTAPNTSFPIGPYPLMAVDTSGGPFNGNLYICWTDGTSTGVPDVLMTRSTDAGRSWSTPIPVSDVTMNSQFMPWVAVDPNGNVNFGFYDRRDDPNDVKIRYYVSRSSDGGVTFQPDVRVSDVDFDPNSYRQGGFIGDFTSVAASDRTLHPLWTDGRSGDNDIYTSRVQLDIHTDVATISAASGGTANFTLNPGPLYQFADYRILGSISGTSPGIDFGPVNLPLDFDLFMLATIYYADSAALPGFTGTLDATGTSTASLVSGPLPPALVGLQLDFAALVKVGNRVRWASNPTHLGITP